MGVSGKVQGPDGKLRKSKDFDNFMRRQSSEKPVLLLRIVPDFWYNSSALYGMKEPLEFVPPATPEPKTPPRTSDSKWLISIIYQARMGRNTTLVSLNSGLHLMMPPWSLSFQLPTQ